MSDEPRDHLSTLAAQALGLVDPTTRSIVPAIYPSVPYERAPDGSYPAGHTYTRDQNPTYDQAEALLSRLEGGQGALLFGSGMAAATTVFETLDTGDHVVAPEQMYWTIRRWLEALDGRGRIALDLIPNGDQAALEAALRPGRTKVVWVETPANPSCALTDIAATAGAAHAAQQQPGLEGTEDGPPIAAVVGDAFPLLVPLRSDQRAGQYVGVPVELLGRRVHDEVGPVLDRTTQHRGAQGAVDNHAGAGGMGRLGGRGDVGDRAGRVGR